jgi:hypothetical protein
VPDQLPKKLTAVVLVDTESTVFTMQPVATFPVPIDIHPPIVCTLPFKPLSEPVAIVVPVPSRHWIPVNETSAGSMNGLPLNPTDALPVV